MADRVTARWIRNASDSLAVKQGCYFDEDAGRFVIEFIETFCRQSKGRWAGLPLQLLEWQKDFLMRLFGWRKADGSRRFRRFYLEVAKKNGKSTMLSALILYLLIASTEGAPEVYINASDREQASIIYDEAARMVRASPELSARLEVIDSKKRILDPANNGKLVANSAEVAQKDGANASVVIFDELHRQKTREMWDIFEYAGASRQEPLTGSITTAGESCDGVWFEQREYSEKVNAGIIPDITHLGVVYRALEGDDLDDPETWRKANPSLGVTLREDDFARELLEAKSVPTKLANFKRLRLNIVTRGATAYIAIETWDLCNAHVAIPSRAPVWMGADLSSIDDLTAHATIAGDPEAGFDVRMKFWLPEEGIAELERRHQVPYRTWAEEGFITLTPGNVVDYSFIRAEVVALADEYDVKALLFDQYNAAKLALELRDQDGLPVQFLRQGFVSLNAPTKELLRLALARKIRHGGNPILRLHASNAVAEQDAAGNIKLSKGKSRKKIDGMSALVNAIAGPTGQDAVPASSVYVRKDLLIL